MKKVLKYTESDCVRTVHPSPDDLKNNVKQKCSILCSDFLKEFGEAISLPGTPVLVLDAGCESP